MADDSALFRERAEAERLIAADSSLSNVRNRSLRAAERWDELADRAERSHAAAIERAAVKAGTSMMQRNPVS